MEKGPEKDLKKWDKLVALVRAAFGGGGGLEEEATW